PVREGILGSVREGILGCTESYYGIEWGRYSRSPRRRSSRNRTRSRSRYSGRSSGRRSYRYESEERSRERDRHRRRHRHRSRSRSSSRGYYEYDRDNRRESYDNYSRRREERIETTRSRTRSRSKSEVSYTPPRRNSKRDQNESKNSEKEQSKSDSSDKLVEDSGIISHNIAHPRGRIIIACQWCTRKYSCSWCSCKSTENCKFVNRFVNKINYMNCMKKNIYLPRSWSGRATKCFFGWVCGYTPGALVPVDRKLNSDGYLDLLEDVFVPTINQVFGNQCTINVIEDNSAIHPTHIVRNWWRDQPRFNRLELPPRSPEINIIEVVNIRMYGLKWSGNGDRPWRPMKLN
ncbi:unnamed protein product, partial [Trichogramma brassicae]